MLNLNKIDNLINKVGNDSKISKGTGIKYPSFRTKKELKSWSPDDIEKLADYFNKPIEYFFDREEKHSIAEEPAGEYRTKCLQCEAKDKEITQLLQEIRQLGKKLEDLREERGADQNVVHHDAAAS